MNDASGTTVLVTGATDGLGRRVALTLASQGATVLLHGRSPERLEATLQEVRDQTGDVEARCYLADLSSLAAGNKAACEGVQPLRKLSALQPPKKLKC